MRHIKRFTNEALTLTKIRVVTLKLAILIITRLRWNSTSEKVYVVEFSTNPFPPTVDFNTNATAPADNKNLCLLITSNVFSTLSFAEVAKAIDSNMSITSSLTAVAASFTLKRGASVALPELLRPSKSMEAEILPFEAELLPLMPPALASFTWRCWDRIGLLLLLSDETMKAPAKRISMVIQRRDMRDISVPAVITEDMNTLLFQRAFLVE